MKVTPSNQTLLLAGERDAPGQRSPSIVERALQDTVLQRLTIVAARPDATVLYLQADYQPVHGPTAAALPALDASAAAVDPREDLADSALAKPASPAASSRGIGLYARTQRLQGAAPDSLRIDVHA